jgi:hypothetical protein
VCLAQRKEREKREKERLQERNQTGKTVRLRTGGGGRENFLGLPLRALPGNQAGGRQVVGADNGAEECGTWD